MEVVIGQLKKLILDTSQKPWAWVGIAVVLTVIVVGLAWLPSNSTSSNTVSDTTSMRTSSAATTGRTTPQLALWQHNQHGLIGIECGAFVEWLKHRRLNRFVRIGPCA